MTDTAKKVLDDRQRALAEDAAEWIEHWLEGMHLREDDVEDWYGVASSALCEAAATSGAAVKGLVFLGYAGLYVGEAVSRAKEEEKNRTSVPPVEALLPELPYDRVRAMEALGRTMSLMEPLRGEVAAAYLADRLTSEEAAERFDVSQRDVIGAVCEFLARFESLYTA